MSLVNALVRPHERLVLSIDGANPLPAHGGTAPPDDQDHSPLRPPIGWLAHNGYAITTEPARRYIDGRRRWTRASVLGSLRTRPPGAAGECRRRADILAALPDLMPETAPSHSREFAPMPAMPHPEGAEP